MAMNGKYSSTVAFIFAEGMESTRSVMISSEVPHLISDIFFQIKHKSVMLKAVNLILQIMEPRNLANGNFKGTSTMILQPDWLLRMQCDILTKLSSMYMKCKVTFSRLAAERKLHLHPHLTSNGDDEIAIQSTGGSYKYIGGD